MLAGFFPTSVTFRGGFRYANDDELERAAAALQELVDGEEEDLASELKLWRKACELRVQVDTTCARDEYLAYETLIEALASFAIAGEVVGEIDNTITNYCAAGAAGTGAAGAAVHGESVAGAIAKALIWIPILASESLLERAGDLAVLA